MVIQVNSVISRASSVGSPWPEGIAAPHAGVAGRRFQSVAVAARPDQGVGPGLVGFDQGGVDRSGEARVVQLDREILTTLAGGLLPGGPEFDLIGKDAVVGCAVVGL